MLCLLLLLFNAEILDRFLIVQLFNMKIFVKSARTFLKINILNILNTFRNEVTHFLKMFFCNISA